MLIPVAVAVTLLALALLLWSWRLRQKSSLPSGRIIYSDTGAWERNNQSFFSRRQRISGRPDYLVRDGQNIIPVEVKSGNAPRVPRTGHILQLAAYCLLVEESLGTRPTYGIVKYVDREFAVDYTPALEAELLRVIEEMRAGAALDDGPHRNHSEVQRCIRCGVRDECSECLVNEGVNNGANDH